jgi:hypothetical protein
MTETELADYWYPAVVNLGLQAGSNLDDVLGIHIYEDYMNNHQMPDPPLSVYWRNLLTLLAGPNGKIILRAYQIKYKVKKVKYDK